MKTEKNQGAWGIKFNRSESIHQEEESKKKKSIFTSKIEQAVLGLEDFKEIIMVIE